MNKNIKKFTASFAHCKIDAFLVTNDINILYLTGYPSAESWLFVVPRKKYFITDFRYIWEARKKLKGTAVKKHSGSPSETVFQLASQNKVTRIGFDPNHISYAVYRRLRNKCPTGITLVALNDPSEKIREQKSSFEIRQIKKAIRINLKAYDFLKRIIKPGIREQDVFRHLENFVRGQKVEFSFNPIIASGPNSCYPHASVTDRKLRGQDVVLIDVGIDINGLKSDLTRMFFLGKIPTHVRKVYDAVRVAQKAAIKKIKPGIQAKLIDLEARNSLKKNRLDKYFGHSLGHGVGLEIHEGPTISVKSPSILKEGMIFTVEPAVYIPHQFGIRVEDMVLVTEKGCRVLSANE